MKSQGLLFATTVPPYWVGGDVDKPPADPSPLRGPQESPPPSPERMPDSSPEEIPLPSQSPTPPPQEIPSPSTTSTVGLLNRSHHPIDTYVKIRERKRHTKGLDGGIQVIEPTGKSRGSQFKI
jgi:hypothetical protein